MDGTVILTKASWVKLLDGVLYPEPDDPGPYGPIGAVIRLGLTDRSWIMLNRQPLPPVAGAFPKPWRLNPGCRHSKLG